MSEALAIHTESLSKRYKPGLTKKPIDAVVDLNLDVNEGEIFAFIGLNGAGKTTTIKLLLDHARPTAGRALLFGRDAHDPKSRTRVGYLPDLPHFYNFLTAVELMDYSGRLFGLSGAERRARSERLLKMVGLEKRGNERLKGFSRGMLQRLGLAQALVNNPDLVLLDEPLGGLDPIGRVELRDVISSLRSEGRTVFFSSHILDDAQRIADRIGIIHHGRMVACGSLEELLTSSPGWDVEAESSDGFDLAKLCGEKGWHTERRNGKFLVTVTDEDGLRTLYKLAADGRIRMLSMGRRRLDLEEAFIEELSRWEA